MAERLWGSAVRHNAGDDHPLVGRSAPDFRLNNGTRLNEHLRREQALLLDFGGGSCLHELAVRYQARLSYIGVDVNDGLRLCALLIRPDGFVVWASDQPSDCSEAEQALSQWLLSPSHAKADLKTPCPL
ncbi:aromatic-ring hydroxylase C-terminal domain-containing protein [Gluconobacter thailandicus]|uniref:Uncharacterized protein n=1 Tax=Gluconobacter thailandicus TaxID=257438 RepID=A0AAP9EU62_GLUTH|nr:hypothetical protein [Gluconobacter thailandicus]QEH97779.1 hypothetical protein FXF46_15895 [Gluconobacter thailandicus]